MSGRGGGGGGRALLISWRSLSVISVFFGFSSCPITDITSCPPCSNAAALTTFGPRHQKVFWMPALLH